MIRFIDTTSIANNVYREEECKEEKRREECKVYELQVAGKEDGKRDRPAQYETLATAFYNHHRQGRLSFGSLSPSQASGKRCQHKHSMAHVQRLLAPNVSTTASLVPTFYTVVGYNRWQWSG